MSVQQPKIIWTKIDEAPALASYSFLPIVKAFTANANITVETVDISLAGRILANFPESLTETQKTKDGLSYLGGLVKKEEANIIKLPNISASIPQLKAAIAELQNKGYNVPNFPEEPKTEEEKDLRDRFAKCLGSAVNPVLREGNSDRRVAPSVKAFAQKNPKKLSDWKPTNKAHVAHMDNGDFFGNEKSIVISKNETVRYEFVNKTGEVSVLKSGLQLLKDEVLDGTFMSVKALRNFISKELEDAKKQGVLFSVHLKATMMKVSDPVIFGHFVSVFFKEIFDKYKDTFAQLGVNADLGLGDLYKKIATLPETERKAIEDDIMALYAEKPDLAMVDSDKGITNLHAGNDIIIDASMPVVVRDGGNMWNKDGKLQETKAVIPDRCYATAYQTVLDFCKKNGGFNPATMGNVSNVGLMAQKAEEYGSHDKTFIAPADGSIRVVNSANETLLEHEVEKGDIYRGCQTKDIPIQDWVKLAVNRAKATGYPTIFWLDKNRAHDAILIKKVETYLKNYDTTELDIRILPPVEAMQFSLEQVKAGKNAISVTGNVLRDYLTDLFPILELGTSAKMLSIVPLLAGGGLFETGAGGSAPKHVQQFEAEGHLRWDSLGEFLALTVSLEHLSEKYGNKKALILSKTLDNAVARFLDNKKSPSRKAGELDNRGSHFFLTQYWADELAKQTEDSSLSEKYAPIAVALKENETKVLEEIAAVEGKATNIGGYYKVDEDLADKAMRPSITLNKIIETI